jgi:transposase InsO family protein
MTEELKEVGVDVGHRRVGRLMRENGIVVERTRIQRQSGCDERDNQDEIARLDFGMIVAISGFCNA